MNRRQFLSGISVSVFPLVGGCTELNDSRRETPTSSTPEQTIEPTPIHESYETTRITVQSDAGKTLGSLTAAIADTEELRYEGLSNTSSLPDDRGMLFVYEEPQAHAFVMHQMDFGLDILFVDGNQAITQIHHAERPGPGEDGEEQLYTGWGQYVLEVNLNWTTERNITEEDILAFTR